MTLKVTCIGLVYCYDPTLNVYSMFGSKNEQNIYRSSFVDAYSHLTIICSGSFLFVICLAVRMLALDLIE
jgi:hypothetical protein